MGLGAMGAHLARHLHTLSLAQSGRPALVWNRSPEKAVRHAEVHGTTAVASLSDLSACTILCLCLSTTADVEAVLAQIPLERGALVIDATSGDPEQTKALAAKLLAERGIRFCDAPVSGGPSGAEAGTCTTMLGGGTPEDVAAASELCDRWSKKVVHCGPVGAGDATKCINNVLNSAHLLLATEGMVS